MARHGIELKGRERLEIAGGELGFDLVELFAEGIDPFGNGGEPFIGQGLQLDRAEVLDLELVLAAPVDEGGLGDVQLGSDSSEGPPLRAEFDKPLDNLVVVHTSVLS